MPKGTYSIKKEVAEFMQAGNTAWESSCDVEIHLEDMETILQEDEQRKLCSLTCLSKIYERTK
jgi:hypothetical protein